MPASTNFFVFNEANDAARTYNDSEYENATQRQTGVIPGMAIGRMHNKMYFQWSSMAKAIADFIVSKGYDAKDYDTAGMTAALESIIAAASSDLGYLLRQNNTAYDVGDIAFSANLPSSIVLQCTTAGTTAGTEPDFSGATIGGVVTDGTAVWTYMPLGTLSREITPAFNHRDVVTTSGTYTAPVTGWYKITVKGGGGGGQGGNHNGTTWQAGGFSGGEGGTSISYERMTAGQTASVVIGAGGAGGAAGGGIGTDGGDSTVTVNSTTITGGGGSKTITGGTGTIPGAPGGPRIVLPMSYATLTAGGSSGGGAGGGNSGSLATYNGTMGGGGAGGGVESNGSNDAGGAGGDGFVWFEFFSEV